MRSLVVGVVIVGVIGLNIPVLLRAAIAPHLVISEIKTSGGSGKTTDEFIELFNPTSADVSLSGWQLIKKTSAGNDYILVDNFGDKIIRAHSFFLITHPAGYLGTVPPDVYYSTNNSISDNNSIVLLDSTQTIIDEVGYGTATVFETEAAANPSANKSLERKAQADSIGETMAEGGAHYFLGNSEDSDNNKNDFVMRDIPEPQNSLAEPEYNVLVPPPFPPTPDLPQPPPVYSNAISISELFPNPKGADDGEFIELYNTGDTPVDLNGWKVSDVTARKFVITPEDFTTTIIAARGYFVIDKKVSAISLNNTADEAKLFYPDDVLANSVAYSGCQEATSYSFVDGKWIWTVEVTPGQANRFLTKNVLPVASFEVSSDILKVGAKIAFDASDSNNPDDDTLTYSWDFGDGEKAGGVKAEHIFKRAGKFAVRLVVSDGKDGEDETEQSLTITDYDYSNTLVINELLPACQGADEECEYIELYNPENRMIKLDGWRLVIKNSSYSFPGQTTIRSHGYLLIKRQESKLSLNNSGATVNIIDPHNTIINTIKYGKAKDDLSYSRVSAKEWQWTIAQTPGQANKIVADDEDESADSSDGEEKVARDLSAITTPLGDVTEGMRGDVLKVSAIVESTSGSNIYLVDEAGNALRAYIQKATGIKKPELKSGDKVEITGIVDKTSAGLRLLPRTQADIVVLAKDSGQVLGASTDAEVIEVPVGDDRERTKTYILLGVFIVLGLAIAVVKLRQRRRGPV